MTDFSFKDWLPALAIFGPILSAIIALIFTRRWDNRKQDQDRKRVTIWVERTDDLLVPLGRQHNLTIVIRQRDADKLRDAEMLNLNRALVGAENTGNACISDFNFAIEIPGPHESFFAERDSSEKYLQDFVLMSWENPETKADPRLHISLNFFNAGEMFKIILFFDGAADNCKVHCRMPGVETNYISV
jgi:hypothetical protein